MEKQKIIFMLNNEEVQAYVEPHTSLLEVLRHELRLTGTKLGCGIGECGACTVIVDGKAVNSCIYPAGKITGKKVITIEGLSSGDQLHPLQEAFIEQGAVQCGYCTPGMIISAKAMLDSNPHPSEEEIRRGISGNLCRCTGYAKIIKAIATAAHNTDR